MSLFSESAMIEILNRSLVGSVVILCVLAVRLGMKRFPKKYLCLLWLIPFGRLLFSVSIPSPVSLLPLPSNPFTESIIAGEKGFSGAVLQLDTGTAAIDNRVNAFFAEAMMPAPERSANPLQIISFMVQIIWFIGFVTFILVNLILYIRLKWSLRDAMPFASEDGSRAGAIKDVYYSERISMPMVAGIIRPRIYLPMSVEIGDKEERRLILAHEEAHRKRWDHLTKLFVFAAWAIHWFNPLVWAAYALYCRDVEMACDELVMEELGEEKRKDYSLALLHFEEKKSMLFLPLAFGESPTKSRIRNILNYKKPRFWVGVTALFIVGAVSVALLTNPEENTEISVIGEADGPTSIFVAGKTGASGGENSGVSVIGGADGPTSTFVAGKTGTSGGEDSGVSVIGGADGPTSIFVAGKIGDSDSEENPAVQAALLDIEAAGKEPYGPVVELDWVRADKISFHGSFGYLSFSLNLDGEKWSAKPQAAFTLEEAGMIVTQGDQYTEVVGGENSCLVVTDAYNPEGTPKFFWYLEDTQSVEEIPAELQTVLLDQGAFKDAYLEADYLPELFEKVFEEYESKLLYGPVAIPEYDSPVFGFLAADGETLETVWYGIWYKQMDRIEKIPLFS